MDLGIIHPVPLAVNDVVTDLHVLDDLGQREGSGAGQPDRSLRSECQQQSTGHLEAALSGDGAMDVARVALTEGIGDVLSDRVEFVGEAVDIGLRQMGECLDVADRH